MRWSLELPVGDPFRVPTAAAAIEAAGFDACFVTDHPAPSREWLAHGGHPTLDPFVALTAAAGATERLRLHTNCVIPAYRHPLVTAKAVATLDAVSGGRVILGVAVGYLEAEFTALGVPFAERAERLDAALLAMRAAWADELEGVTVQPAPVQRPGPPVWVGGNSVAAMRRAVTHGTGWSPFPAAPRTAAAVGTAAIADIDALADAIARFRAVAAEAGRDPDAFDICFTPFSHPAHREVVDPAALVAEARDLAALGVTWCAFHVPAAALADYGAAIREVGE